MNAMRLHDLSLQVTKEGYAFFQLSTRQILLEVLWKRPSDSHVNGL